MRTILMVALIGCTGSTVGDDGVPSSDTDTPPGPTEPVPTPPEVECDDTVDNDSDGAVDCDDTDCQAEVHCSWPTTVSFLTTIDYDASVLAEFAGFSDCQVEANAVLVRDRSIDCPACDWVMCGTYTYTLDNCPQDAGLERPPSGCYGFTFDATDSAWPVFIENADTGAWETIGNAVAEGNGWLSLTSQDPVIYEGADAGTVSSYFGFMRQ